MTSFGAQLVEAEDERVFLTNGRIQLDGPVTLLHDLQTNIVGRNEPVLKSRIGKMADQGHERGLPAINRSVEQKPFAKVESNIRKAVGDSQLIDQSVETAEANSNGQ